MELGLVAPKYVAVKFAEAVPPMLLLPARVKPLKSGKLKVVVPLPLPQGKNTAVALTVVLALAANVTLEEVLEIMVEKPAAKQETSTGIPIQKFVVSPTPLSMGLPELQNTD